jgi:retron-type reverse transcriptase
MLRIEITHIYDSIISLENLLGAWREFISGKRGRKDVQLFQMNLMDNILQLQEDLKSKIYQHGAYQAFNVSDPKPRNIHKATVRDRLLHHAIYRSLYPLYDQTFAADSYSCRNGKGTHKALDRFQTMARQVSINHTHTVWILKCDVRKFFASIDHEILLAVLDRRITDVDTLALLKHIIKSFETNPGKGLPLGNLTSQLLVNIYMDVFDEWLKRDVNVKHYIRYADDFIILHQDRDYLLKIVQSIVLFLRTELHLELHPNKVSITTFASGVDFLGWVHFPHERVLRTSTKRRVVAGMADADSSTAQSYRGLLSHGDTYGLLRISQRRGN